MYCCYMTYENIQSIKLQQNKSEQTTDKQNKSIYKNHYYTAQANEACIRDSASKHSGG